MAVLIAQVSGVVAFLTASLVLGVILRRRREPDLAEITTRVSHLAFWLGLVAPWAVGFLYPGTRELDRLTGLGPLPLPLWLRIAAGGAMLVIGVAVMQASMAALRRRGRGAPAFRLTRSVVDTGLYAASRNPMALGFYLGCLGGAVFADSTWVLLYTALGVIPVHLFNLKFFEELELLLRYGESYERYRRSTPFLIPRIRFRSTDPR